MLGRSPRTVVNRFETADLAAADDPVKLSHVIEDVHKGLYRPEEIADMPGRIALWAVERKDGETKVVGSPPRSGRWILKAKPTVVFPSVDGTAIEYGYFEDETHDASLPVFSPLLGPRDLAGTPRPTWALVFGIIGFALLIIATLSSYSTGNAAARAHDVLAGSPADVGNRLANKLSTFCEDKKSGHILSEDLCATPEVTATALENCITNLMLLTDPVPDSDNNSTVGNLEEVSRTCNAIWSVALELGDFPEVAEGNLTEDSVRKAGRFASWLPRFLAQTGTGIAEAAALSIAGYYFLALLAVLLIFMALGFRSNGRWSGLVISGHNRMSLSLFQIAMWTILILSAYAVYAAFNVGAMGRLDTIDEAPSLFPTMEDWTWAVMGIVAVSPLLSAVIKGQKPKDAVSVEPTTVAGAVEVELWPLSDSKRSPTDASFWDLFFGEDENNDDQIVFTRTQHVIITAILMLTYAGWIVATMRDVSLARLLQMYPNYAPVFTEFPIANATFAALLALTHAGYLTGKWQPVGIKEE